MEKPKPTWTRERLVQWLEDHGDDEARKVFVDAAFSGLTRKMTKADVYNLCRDSYNRSTAA